MAKTGYKEQLVVRVSKDDKRELREGLRQIKSRGVIEQTNEGDCG